MMKPTASELKRMRSSAQLVLKPSKKEEYFQCGFQIHVEVGYAQKVPIRRSWSLFTSKQRW